MQTVAPLAALRQQTIRVDRGFGEIMPERNDSPLPSLLYENQRSDLPRVPSELLAEDNGSPVSHYPDIEGPEYYRQGDTEQRRRTVERHAGALERAFSAVGVEEGARTILVRSEPRSALPPGAQPRTHACTARWLAHHCALTGVSLSLCVGCASDRTSS
jgi:hypothetical protein